LPFCHRILKAPTPRHGYPKQFKHLGDHLVARRIDLGLLQKEVATLVGVSTGTLRGWESGRTEPEVKYFPGLIQFLGRNPLPDPQTPGQAIRTKRLSLGLSQAGLGMLAGVDEGSVRRLQADTKGMARRVGLAVRTRLGLGGN